MYSVIYENKCELYLSSMQKKVPSNPKRGKTSFQVLIYYNPFLWKTKKVKAKGRETG